jgi:DNA-binding NarL/FixJ family response regulator
LPDFAVVGEASSGEAAVRRFMEVQPDLVLMDLELHGRMDGVAAIRAIRELVPEAKVLVVSNYAEGERVQEAFRAGALGYQLKGTEIEELVKAIRQTIRGVHTLAPVAAQSLVRIASHGVWKLGADLTDREHEVLTLLAQGLSNRAIADQMVITVATVKFHLHSVRAKLGTTTRTETVAVAFQQHLITPTR